MHVNVRSVGVGRVGVCMLCVGDSEQRPFWLRKKPMNLYACDSEQRERGVGASVNVE